MDRSLIAAIAIGIVSVIILINFVSGAISPAQSAMETIRGDPCNAGGGYYNSTSDACQINSTNQTAYTAYTGYALEGLYTRTGVFFIVMLAAALLVAILGFMRYVKNN